MGHHAPAKDICRLRHSSHGKPESGRGHFGVTESTVHACEKAGPVLQAPNINVCGYVNLKEPELYDDLIRFTDLGHNRSRCFLNALNSSHGSPVVYCGFPRPQTQWKSPLTELVSLHQGPKPVALTKRPHNVATYPVHPDFENWPWGQRPFCWRDLTGLITRLRPSEVILLSLHLQQCVTHSSSWHPLLHTVERFHGLAVL